MTFATQPNEYQNQVIAIIGYGVSGKACVEYLLAKGAVLTVFDTAFNDEALDSYKSKGNIRFCVITPSLDLRDFCLVVVSPGVDPKQAFLQNYQRLNQERQCVVGEIELFARELNAQNDASQGNSEHNTQTLTSPLNAARNKILLIAVTGSNGKSTVVDMLYKACLKQGLRAELGGNFGTSALSLLAGNESTSSRAIDVIVLELSSFQLESTFSLRADAACILNVSEDHLDRHGSIENYSETKQRIYLHARNLIFNINDVATYPFTMDLPQNTVVEPDNLISFGHVGNNSDATNTTADDIVILNKRLTERLSHSKRHSIYQSDHGIYCANELLLDVSQFPPLNNIQLLNMQAVLACCKSLNMDIPTVVSSLREYEGLPHRFALVYQNATTLWINDSKATNPGACIAAIESLAERVDYIVLIAGGDAKGCDVKLLSPLMKKHINHLVLIGKDANLFTHFDIPYVISSSMTDAVEVAASLAQSIVEEHASVYKLEQTDMPLSPADQPFVGVLLSPACASIDMFSNYRQRGEHFSHEVLTQMGA